jgi:NTP pyrophosphatase (non-canonical NTP hydrolase)
MDESMPIAELRRLVGELVAERDWSKFHNPKNLAMALAVEAAELMELFTWQTEAETAEPMKNELRQSAIDELADVVIFALAFANRCDVDLAQAITAKLAKNREKYPAHEFQGRV